MEIAAEPIPTHNDDMNDHLNIMIQVDWNDGVKNWRANFTHVSQYLTFKNKLKETRMRNLTGFPFIQKIEKVYY